MSDQYLRLAEQVLRTRGRPLSAQEILNEAARFAILPAHLSGATMQKTLQARISDDIHQQREKSSFYRTGLGRYFLRAYVRDPTLPQKVLEERPPPGRKRPASKFRMLFCDLPERFKERSFWTFSDVMKEVLRSNYYESIGNQRSTSYAVGTIAVLKHGDLFFTYKVGRHSAFYDAGCVKSISLRRYVDEFDRDLFTDKPFGFDLSIAREIIRNFNFNKDLENLDDRIVRQAIEVLGGLIEHDQKILFLSVLVDFSYLFKEPLAIRRRLDVREPRWVSFEELSRGKMDAASLSLLDRVPKA